VRVLFVHRQQGTTVGGGWRAFLRMIGSVGARGVEAELLFTCDIQRPQELPGLVCDRLLLPPARKGKSFFLYPGALRRLVIFLRNRRPDIVHLNDLDDAIFFVAACSMAGRIPAVGHVRSVHVPRKFRKLWAHRLSCLVCVSQDVRRRAVEGGVPPGRTLVLHDPPDPRWEEWPDEVERVLWREKLGIPAGAPVIGTVGNISRVKGTDVLVRALPQVAAGHPEVRCIIVGGDDHGLREELCLLAERTGVSRNLVFTGPLEDPRPAVSLMDVFALPSREEGYGIVLLEAMSYGRPVVASRTGGIPDIVDGEDIGVLVPPDRPGELAAALSSLLGDKVRRERFSAAGHARVREAFGDFQAERLCARYQALTARRTGGA
jgi:glycosyltransferase involved in cell wall biosynthesis